MLQQSTINEEDKIRRKKYVLNNTKTVIRGFRHVIVEEACLLGCCALWSGNLFSTFRINRLHSQGYESAGIITLRMEAVRFFETSGISYQTTRRNNPEDLHPRN